MAGDRRKTAIILTAATVLIVTLLCLGVCGGLLLRIDRGFGDAWRNG